MSSNASKNPVRAAFKLVQQVWGKPIQVQSCDCQDHPLVFRFQYLEIIGNGTFGIVCRAKDLDTNEIVAIKTVYQDEGHQNRELGIIKGLKHPNIVGLRRYFYTRNEQGEEFLSLVLDYMPMSLDRVVKEAEKKKQTIPESFVRLAMYQFMRALEYLHGIGICHRDIKPHNLLVDLDAGIVKLCDFGCSKRLIEGEPNIQYICARYYRAPEVVFGWAHYTCAIDVWSAGCVMAEMISLHPIFPGKNSVDQLARIVKILGPPSTEQLSAMGQEPKKFKLAAPKTQHEVIQALQASLINNDQVSAEALKFLLDVLTYDPKNRLTALQALSHPYFASITGIDSSKINTKSIQTSKSQLDHRSASITDSKSGLTTSASVTQHTSHRPQMS
jgi:glycogen synthase kinase 3 beta